MDKHVVSVDFTNARCDGKNHQVLVAASGKAINIATREYEKYPPNKYNRDGYNLYKRLAMTREHVFLFLYDLSVPPTNNASERALRKVKRKMKKMTKFRSYKNFEWYCDALSILSTWKLNNENIYILTKNILRKPKIVQKWPKNFILVKKFKNFLSSSSWHYSSTYL